MTNPSMTDPTTIARGLTEAQREAVADYREIHRSMLANAGLSERPLAQDAAALVEALRFYADAEQYRYDRIGQHMPIENDCGETARTALAKFGDKP